MERVYFNTQVTETKKTCHYDEDVMRTGEVIRRYMSLVIAPPPNIVRMRRRKKKKNDHPLRSNCLFVMQCSYASCFSLETLIDHIDTNYSGYLVW